MVLEGLVHDEQTNAVIAWLLTGTVAVDGLESLFTDVPFWGGFELLVAAVAAAPAVAARDWTAIVSWPLLSVAALATIAGGSGFPSETAAYLAVATLALVAVAELEAFSSVELSRRFALFFAVLTTMALQALWTIAQFYSDQWFGTDYLRTQTELQWDFVIVTAVALVLGGLFQWYFARVEPAGAVSRTTNGAGPP
ncbi:hypothetical protein [Natrinema caseinilyticum]|uniref:hypothetical protein n=1 Tax=Natrinema caseinilyticum TaxID=2961570 RepID=UPI0020C373FE|nr:hypothetical protein [Natrinema caseinilyticum]